MPKSSRQRSLSMRQRRRRVENAAAIVYISYCFILLLPKHDDYSLLSLAWSPCEALTLASLGSGSSGDTIVSLAQDDDNDDDDGILSQERGGNDRTTFDEGMLNEKHDDRSLSKNEANAIKTCNKQKTNTQQKQQVKSFSIQHSTIPKTKETQSNNRDNVYTPDSTAVYEEYMQGCRQYLKVWNHLCDESEAARIERNSIQPPMMKNFTKLGFQKVRTPPSLQNRLRNFWWSNAHQTTFPDTWGFRSTSSFNFWVANTRSMSIDNPLYQRVADDSFYGNNGRYDEVESTDLRTQIWNEIQPIIEKWSNTTNELSPSALYGIRVFGNNAIIPPHVDAPPFVLSAVIHVASTTREPWVMEMLGHDGKVYNLTTEPGDMVLYEGQSVIHGRPFPMNGVFHSDIFVHFEPFGYSRAIEGRVHSIDGSLVEASLDELYQQTLTNLKRTERRSNSKELENKMMQNTKAPRYVSRESMKRWMQTHPRAKLKYRQFSSSVSAHTAAALGDIEVLITLAQDDPKALEKQDENGWTPLHEAVRSGSVETIEYLVKYGLDINQRTHGGSGGTPLWWAKILFGLDHDVVKYLQSIGAKDIAPDDYNEDDGDDDDEL
mmetsp:Transcript_31574/g.65674  ORF Transcript_31574/g.65674 Transcript_31574/m.65674 type:complete len:604 (+) Transcript_31574:38-1849(+)